MSSNNIKKVYDALKSSGYTDMGSLEEFTSSMSDNNNRKLVYDALSQEGYSNLGDFDAFSNRMSGSVSEPTPDTTEVVESTNVAKQEIYEPIPVSATDDTTIRGFVPAFEQSADQLDAGIKYAVGEYAEKSSDYENAYNRMSELIDDGVDFSNFNVDKQVNEHKKRDYYKQLSEWKAEIAKREEERKGMKGMDALKHRWNDPKKPTDPFDRRALATAERYTQEGIDKELDTKRTYTLIEQALKDADGNVEKAKTLLDERRKQQTWGERMQEEAKQTFSDARPTEGFGAWLGNLAPQMVGNTLAVAAMTNPYTRWLARPLGMANMAALTASSGGSSAYEARKYGEEKGVEIDDATARRAGLLSAGIEAATEYIPFENYYNVASAYTKKKLGNIINRDLVSSPRAQGELAKLVERASKELGGTLINGKNIKEWVVDAGLEGLSEFMAEGGGALIPMIYQNEKDYPTLKSILVNGWEGAKAGMFMGAFLGGSSRVVNHYANRDRRKKAGHVDLAETTDGNIVEVLGFTGDDYSVMLPDGGVKHLKREELGDIVSIPFSEFDKETLSAETISAYEEGKSAEINQYYNVNVSAEEAFAVIEEKYPDMAEQAKSWVDASPSEVQRYLNDLPEDERVDIGAYLAAEMKRKGVIDGVKERTKAEVESFSQQLEDKTDANGNVSTATYHEQQVFVKDVQGDNAVIILDGKPAMVNSKELSNISTQNAGDVVAEYSEQASTKAAQDTDFALNNHPKTHVLSMGEMMNDVDGKTYKVVQIGGSEGARPEQMLYGVVECAYDAKNGADVMQITYNDMLSIQNDYYNSLDAKVSQQVEANNMSAKTTENEGTPTEQIGQSVSEEVADGQNIEIQPTEEVAESVAPAVPQTARERVPKDKKGNPIYEQTDADTAWDAIVEETEGDTEMAQRVASDMLEDKKAALAKLQNGKPKKGATVAEKIANEKAHAAAIAQAQNDIAQWEAIAGTEARRREAAMSEADRYAAEMEQKNISEGLKALGEPQSLEEYVLAQLAGGSYKLRWSDKENGTKGFGSHTGLSTEEMKARLSMINNENGLTPEEIAHSIVENMDMSFGEVDVMDVTNMVIDAVSTHASRRAMLNGMVESRAELLRQQARAEQEVMDAWYMEQYHATEEELAAYNEYLAEFAEEIYGEDTDYEQRIATFAEIQLGEYDNQGTDAGLRSSADQGEGLASDREGGRSVGEREQLDRRELREDAAGVAEAEDGRAGGSVSAESDDRQSRIDRAIADYRENVDDSPEAIAAAERDQQRYEADMAEDAAETVETLENGDVRRTNFNSNGEIATVAIERDGNVISVDTYDDGALFERTDYDANGNATKVTRYKDGEVVSEQEYKDGKRNVTANYFEMAEEAQKNRKSKEKSNDKLAEKNHQQEENRSETRGVGNRPQLQDASSYESFVERVAEYLQRSYKGTELSEEVANIIRDFNKGKTILARTEQEKELLGMLRVMTNKDVDWLLSELQTKRDALTDEKRKAYDDAVTLVSRYRGRGEHNAVVRALTGANLREKLPLTKIDELFDKYNSDADVAELYRRVRAIAEQIGLDFWFDDNMIDVQVGGFRSADNRVRFNAHMLYSPFVSEQTKASVIVHEILHAVADYAIETQRDVKLGLTPKVQLSKQVLSAANTILNIYEKAVKGNPLLVHEEYDNVSGEMKVVPDYGTDSAREMLMEISNPEFRDKLKQIEYKGRSVWQKIWDAIKSMFAQSSDVTNPTAYDSMAKALDVLINEFSVDAYQKYSGIEENAMFIGERGASEENLRFREKDNQKKPLSLQKPSAIVEKISECFYDDASRADRIAMVEYLQQSEEGREVIERLYKHRGSGWARQAVNATMVRIALHDLINGREPSVQSMLTRGTEHKVVSYIRRMGAEGVWRYLEEKDFLSEAAKPLTNVNGSFLSCNPSAECAKYCYATKGHYTYAGSTVKSELVYWAVDTDPNRAADRIYIEYQALRESAQNKALRLFDKGDLDEAWLPVIDELNRRGIVTQIFSKRSEVLQSVDGSRNVVMLSIDHSNADLLSQYPTMPIAFIYRGRQDMELLEQCKERFLQYGGVILPVKVGQKVLSKEELEALPSWTRPCQCPIDNGTKQIVNKENPERSWNCTKCDKNGGVGCFFKRTAKQLKDNRNESKRDGLVSRTDRDGERTSTRNEESGIGGASTLHDTNGGLGESEIRGGILQTLRDGGIPDAYITPELVEALVGRIRGRNEDGARGGNAGGAESVDAQSSNTLGREGSKGNRSERAGGIDEQTDILFRDGAPFFSNAERAVENIKQQKATPEQWLAMIKKDGGLKAGEDKWMGLSDWLNEQKEKGVKTLTKDEVLAFIRESQIEIEEVEYGDLGNTRLEELQAEFDELVGLGEEGTGSIYTSDWADWAFEAMVERYGDDFRNAFRVEQGYNTFPRLEAEEDYDGNMSDAAKHFLGANPINSTRLDYTTEGLDNKKEIALVVPTIEPWNERDEVHFGDAGDGRAVAWVRFGETTDKDGNRVLVIDEVQSKRHDEGRAKGYQSKEKGDLLAERDRLYDKIYSDGLTEEEFNRRNEINARLEELGEGRIPDAPFDKNYHELVMKRMLRYAAENGFDKVAWTKGAQQTKRYGLGAIIDQVDIRDWEDGDRLVYLRPKGARTSEYIDIDRDGKILYSSSSSLGQRGQNIADIYGRELSEKMLNDKAEKIDDVFSIGGEDRNALYDEMIPRFMNKYTKKWGTKVGEVTLPKVEKAGRTMWSVDVTPEMKESVMQGQPMFREGMGAISDREVSYENDPIAKFQGKPRYYGKRAAAFAERERRRMENAAKKASEMLGIEVEIVTDASTLQGRRAKEKGWYDIINKKVVVVVPNHVSMGDAVITVLHEGVAHHGLRELFGDGFDAMLDNVYNNVAPELKARIDAIAERTGVSTSVATEEYLASLAETTNFEEAQRRGWWAKIKQYFVKMLNKLGMPGLNLKEELTDNELRYLLWRSYRNLVDPNSYLKPLGYIDDVAKQKELKVGEYSEKKQAAPIAAEMSEAEKLEAEGWAAITMQRIEELEAQMAQLDSEIAEMEADRDADDEGRYDVWEQQIDPLRKQLEDVYAEIEGLYSLEAEAEEMSMASEDAIRYRLVDDQAEIERLESEPTIKAYRAMQVINGEFYPPMSAVVDGKLREPIALGQWEQSEERPDLADDNGRFKLDKGNKKSLKAAYNPYFHSSSTPLNDQFSEAQDRDNLVTVEVEVPVSEADGTSGYKAEKAKDAVGTHQWKAGIIQGQLTGTREVFLTRWDKPIRIVPESEVADVIVEMFGGKDIVMPSNVVTPQLRKELEARGIAFVETDNQGKLVEGEHKGEHYSKVYGKKAESTNKSNKKAEIIAEVEREAAALGVPVRIARSVDELPDADTRKRAVDGKLKGYYDPRTNEVVLYAPNTDDANDAKRTILHEIVGHKGLRELIGEKEYDAAMVRLMYLLPSDVRDAVLRRAEKHAWNAAIAMDEYLAEKAEQEVTMPWWGRVNAWMRAMFRKRGFDVKLSDADVKYLLWRSRKKLRGDDAYDMAFDNKLKRAARQSARAEAWVKDNFTWASSDSAVRERTKALSDMANAEYEDAVMSTQAKNMLSGIWYALKNGKKGFKSLRNDMAEAYLDGTRAVAEAQKAIEKKRGRKIRGYEDIHSAHNAKSSRDQREIFQLNDNILQPMSRAVANLINKAGKSFEEFSRYLNAKHGLERNVKFAERDAENESEKLRQNAIRSAERIAESRRERAEADYNDAVANLYALRNEGGVGAVGYASQSRKLKEQYDNNLSKIDTDFKAAIAQAEEDKKTKREELLKEYRKNDYSGLTAIFTMENEEKKPTIKELERRAQEYVDAFESSCDKSQLDLVWKLIRIATKFSVEKMYNSGLISKEQRDSMMNNFEYYVPLRGWKDDYTGDVYSYIASGNPEAVQQVIKHAKGRKSEADNILGTIFSMANYAIVLGNKNEVNLKLLNLAYNDPSGLLNVEETWYEKTESGELVPLFPDMSDENLTSEQKMQKIEEYREKVERLKNEGKAKLVRNPFKEGYPLHAKAWQEQQHAVMVKRGGEEFVVWVNGNPKLAQALNGLLHKSQREAEDNMMSNILRWMAATQTSYSPEFWLTNLQRDLITANTGNFIKYGAGYEKEFAKNLANLLPVTSFTGKKDKLSGVGIFKLFYLDNAGKLDMSNPVHKMFKEFADNGGMTGISQITDPLSYEKKMLKEIDKELSGIKSVPVEAVEAIGNGVEFINRGFENATRFATYMTSRQMGKGVTESIRDAKDVSVNFNMKGSGAWGNAFMRKYFIYFNAAIQGLRTVATWHEASKKRFYSVGGSVIAASVALAIINDMLSGGDDDDENAYYGLSEWNRYNFFNIKIGENSFLHWSLPQEYRPIYALGQIGYDLVSGRISNDRALKSAIVQLNNLSPFSFVEDSKYTNPDDTFLEAIIKGLVPSQVKPLVDAYITNEDFLGRRVHGQTDSNRDLPEYKRVTETTPQFLIEGSRVLSEISGGRENKRGLLDNKFLTNPSITWYLLKAAGGGTITFLGKFANMSKWDEEWTEVPILPKFVATSGDDYSKQRLTNDKYWKYRKGYEEIHKELTRNKNDEDMSKERKKEIGDELKQGEKYEYYTVLKKYEGKYKKYKELIEKYEEEGNAEKEQEYRDKLFELKKKIVAEIEDNN